MMLLFVFVCLIVISDLESRNIPIDEEVTTVENDFSPGETRNVDDDLAEPEYAQMPKKLNEGSALDKAMTRKEDVPIVNKRQAKEDRDYETELVGYLHMQCNTPLCVAGYNICYYIVEFFSK